MTEEKRLNVIKIGGNVIDNEEKLKEFLSDFSKIDGPKILIHGGGKIATAMADKMGIPQKLIDGRRVTDAPTLQLITMVYGGLIGKNIIAQLAALGNDALSLSGADINSVNTVRRPTEPIDFGYVGDLKAVHAKNIQKLLEADFIPVFCALTHDGHGQLLNTNADTMAAGIATAMSQFYKTKLYYCFEKKGVLENRDDENSVIPQLSYAQYLQLKNEEKIVAGMIPKLDTAFEALENGVDQVTILQADYLLQTLLFKENHGTEINYQPA